MRLQAPPVSGATQQAIAAYCLATDVVGDVVYIVGPKIGNRYQVSRVDIDNPVKWLGIGIVIYKSGTTICVVQTNGLVQNVYTGLTPNANLFVDTNGRLREGPPGRPGSGRRTVQPMGRVLASADLLLSVESPIILRA